MDSKKVPQNTLQNMSTILPLGLWEKGYLLLPKKTVFFFTLYFLVRDSSKQTAASSIVLFGSFEPTGSLVIRGAFGFPGGIKLKEPMDT